MRILFVSQLFDPENSIKGLEFAKRLQALGHEVEVITTFPSYPGGKIFPGYRMRWHQVEEIDGVRIVRLPTIISHGRSAVKRMLSYASFGVVSSCHALFFARKADVIYAYYPPVIVGFAAMLVRFFRKTPFVYDVQDLWPEALVATGMVREGRITRFVDRLCGFIYRSAARVVVLSDGYQRALESKKTPRDKIKRIFNWCDEGRTAAVAEPKEPVLDPGYFNVLYAGNMGAAQALSHVVDAAALVEKQGMDRIRFVFLGAGVECDALKRQASELGLSNVRFLPQVTVDKVSGILAAADVLLVHLADAKVFEITIPSKTQAYMKTGRPILMAVKGEAADIVADAQAGVVVEPCQPQKLAEAVLNMSALPRVELDEMGRRGRDYYTDKMSMENGVRQVDSMLRQIVENA
ncbi:glycosyltransferase family 4 protein [Cupriavidus metallidurans]|uniref:glycosyltransferase family 4 protein n=1 Tax=Cupriavidus metallidurans TaxID=119219 RepID=UPI001CCEC401|nr:glycosyltransferase family 4 protein [Cupriavidus metallidurans]UBM10285.1 glycosyltransferase family 4 protein [Cupriavidus metallidurans]